MSEHYEYLCRGCGHHERDRAGWPGACAKCGSYDLLRSSLFPRPRRARSEQARIESAVLDASMALYRKRTDASQRQWPEYEAWRQACAELAAFIGEGEAA